MNVRHAVSNVMATGIRYVQGVDGQSCQRKALQCFPLASCRHFPQASIKHRGFRQETERINDVTSLTVLIVLSCGRQIKHLDEEDK